MTSVRGSLAFYDDLAAGVGEPVEGAVFQDGVVEESEPLVDSPVGGNDESGGRYDAWL